MTSGWDNVLQGLKAAFMLKEPMEIKVILSRQNNIFFGCKINLTLEIVVLLDC